jgi:hypothetical protein
MPKTSPQAVAPAGPTAHSQTPSPVVGCVHAITGRGSVGSTAGASTIAQQRRERGRPAWSCRQRNVRPTPK